MSNCNVKIQTDFGPGIWDLENMRVGYTYATDLFFKNENGDPIDVTADDFDLIVKDSDGNTVKTFTIGDGIEYGAGVNEIDFLIGPPATTDAGTYRVILVWTQSTGASFPVLEGEMLVTT